MHHYHHHHHHHHHIDIVRKGYSLQLILENGTEEAHFCSAGAQTCHNNFLK